MLIRKVRQRCHHEEYALNLMREKRFMAEQDLINALADNGAKKTKSQEIIIYLINSHDVKRSNGGLEFIEWRI